MSEQIDALKNQIIEASGNVQYTFVAHWKIINRLEKINKNLKIIQIVITGLSTCGFVATILSGMPNLAWIGGLMSAIGLAINLYMLDFNLPNQIQQHKDAANALWEVREGYKSLLVDFDSLTDNEKRATRNTLIARVSTINKQYPGTDDKGFKKAQKDIKDYTFKEGEAAKVINMSTPDKPNNSKEDK